MIAAEKACFRVADLMDRQGLGLDGVVRSTGIDEDVVKAIARQRYTPSLDQRERVSRVLGVRRGQIIWGHATPVQEYIHAPD